MTDRSSGRAASRRPDEREASRSRPTGGRSGVAATRITPSRRDSERDRQRDAGRVIPPSEFMPSKNRPTTAGPVEATPAARPDRRLHLPPLHRAQIEALLREHLPGVDVWAYGSRITGESHDGSDLDLVLRAPGLEKVPMDPLCDLWDALRESTIPYLVEVRDWARLPESFHGEIERDYVVLVEEARDSAQRTDRSTETERLSINNIEWGHSTIGEIADVIGGGTPFTKDLSNFGGDIPWITPKDLSGFPSRYVSSGARNLSQKGFDSSAARLLPTGTVLLSTRAPIGYVAVAANPVTTNQGFRNLILKDGFSPDFYFYWLSDNVPELERHASGSTFNEISGTAVKQINVPVPPFSEQHAIAHVLGTLDDRIELNLRMNETLEAIARALFKSWFVDFDPVRAKMEGRNPGLPKDLADLFPDRMVTSELGKIPEGWTVRSLGEEVTTVKGRSYKSRELIDSETALVTLKSFSPGGGYRPGGLKPFNGRYNQDQVVLAGEVVISCTDVTQAGAVIGRPAIVQGAAMYKTLVASLDMFIVRPYQNDGLTTSFIYYLACTNNFREHTYALTTGTTVLHLNKNAIPSFSFVRPPKELIRLFDDAARPILESIRRSLQCTDSLAVLRDVLLPKLVSGDVKIGKEASTWGGVKNEKRRSRSGRKSR